MGEVLRKTLAKIENQFHRRAAAIGLSDFLHNVRLDYFEGICYVEGGEVCRFQLRGYDSVQQVQSLCDTPGTHFLPPYQSEKICPLSAAPGYHPLP